MGSDRIGRSGAGVGYTPSAFHWQPGVVHSVSIWSTERRRAPCTGTPSPWDARAAGLAMGSCRPLWRFPRPAKRDFVPQHRVASVVTRDSSRGTAPGTRAGCRRPGTRDESHVTAQVTLLPTVCNDPHHGAAGIDVDSKIGLPPPLPCMRWFCHVWLGHDSSTTRAIASSVVES